MLCTSSGEKSRLVEAPSQVRIRAIGIAGSIEPSPIEAVGVCIILSRLKTERAVSLS
jgi:hypothetical protein